MMHTLPSRRSEYAGQHYPERSPLQGAITTRHHHNPPRPAWIPSPQPPTPMFRQAAVVWTLIGMALAAGALVAALVLGTGTSDDAGTMSRSDRLVPAGDFAPTPVEPTSEESALDRLVTDFKDAAAQGPTSNWMDFYCAADRDVIVRNGDGEIIVPTEGFNERTALTGVTVSGSTAQGRLDAEPATFRKEAGRWTFCMSSQ